MKRREAKSKGEKERYTHLYAEFQRIARRGKKSLPQRSMQRNRETVEWKRLEISSRKLDTKGTSHAKMGSIKDRNVRDLTEAKDTRGGKNTQKNCTKKIFMTQIITMV